MTTYIAPGTLVRVSDNTPQPPARFKRKLQDWEELNYDAVVIAVEEAFGKTYYKVQRPIKSSVISFFSYARIDRCAMIDGAKTYKLVTKGDVVEIDQAELS